MSTKKHYVRGTKGLYIDETEAANARVQVPAKAEVQWHVKSDPAFTSETGSDALTAYGATAQGNQMAGVVPAAYATQIVEQTQYPTALAAMFGTETVTSNRVVVLKGKDDSVDITLTYEGTAYTEVDLELRPDAYNFNRNAGFVSVTEDFVEDSGGTVVDYLSRRLTRKCLLAEQVNIIKAIHDAPDRITVTQGSGDIDTAFMTACQEMFDTGGLFPSLVIVNSADWLKWVSVYSTGAGFVSGAPGLVNGRLFLGLPIVLSKAAAAGRVVLASTEAGTVFRSSDGVRIDRGVIGTQYGTSTVTYRGLLRSALAVEMGRGLAEVTVN